jgi:hypothetical protein
MLSRCTQIPESRSFVFNPFPGFNCIVAALKSRTIAQKTHSKVPVKVVPGFQCRSGGTGKLRGKRTGCWL